MKFFRDFTVLAGGQTVSKLLGFLAFAWLARALDPVHYGAVEYIIGLAAMFTMIVEGGLDVVGTRRVAHRPTDLAPLAFQVFVARLLFALVCVPSFVIATTVTVHDTIPHGLVWLYALSLLAIPWRQLWLFQATGRMSVIANAEIIRMTVFSAIVWLAVRRSEDVLMVGWAEIAAVTTMALFYLILQHRNIVPVRFTGSIAGFGLLLREGVTVGSTSLVWALCQLHRFSRCIACRRRRDGLVCGRRTDHGIAGPVQQHLSFQPLSSRQPRPRSGRRGPGPHIEKVLAGDGLGRDLCRACPYRVCSAAGAADARAQACRCRTAVADPCLDDPGCALVRPFALGTGGGWRADARARLPDCRSGRDPGFVPRARENVRRAGICCGVTARRAHGLACRASICAPQTMRAPAILPDPEAAGTGWRNHPVRWVLCSATLAGRGCGWCLCAGRPAARSRASEGSGAAECLASVIFRSEHSLSS
ncbi:MAG: lipopolysaccharide biosynthesis protein [Sphingomonadales bacterium]|nr:lipopolysaccharide biosynthesis protein [Sphingomonadales bacterium]